MRYVDYLWSLGRAGYANRNNVGGITKILTITMKNLIYHFPTCYAYSVKKAYKGTKPEESFR